MSSLIIKKYFPQIAETQLEQFERLQEQYTFWNERINVISRKDIENLYVNHVLHSLGIAKVIEFKKGTSILDVGTGGGFPGIPLAILFPEVQFYLIDSIGKKIKVVMEISEALGLKNIHAEHIRAEDVKGKYDFVVSRAVTRMKEFYGWIKNKLRTENNNTLTNGILYLKGGDLEEEMKELGKTYKTYNLPDFFEEDFFETKKVIYVPM